MLFFVSQVIFTIIYSSFMSYCTHLQVKHVGGRKVLQTKVLYVDEYGKSLKLCEILHTTRNYLGYMQCLRYIESELSRLKDEGPGGLGCAMASGTLLLKYTFTDKDLAILNALALTFNGIRYIHLDVGQPACMV